MNASSCPHCGQPIQLMKGVAVPSAKPVAAPQPRAELKLVRCNRCGDENLCWQESKNGKFYLCKTRREDGRVIPLRKEFHVCNPSEAF
jgi:hypothetical protein